jgi:DNA-binding transcriptional regulator YiaG
MTSSDKKLATAEELLALRQEVGHTQQEAADFLYVTTRTYQNWEYSKSRIPYAIFELYVLKAISRGLVKNANRHEAKGKGKAGAQ